MTLFSWSYLSEIREILMRLDADTIERCVDLIVKVRKHKGRVFVLGIGGSAANASHAVNDFRKLAGIEAYAPTDNVAELTARINDNNWSVIFFNWLETSHLSKHDLLLVLSVGGGTSTVSSNIVAAVRYASEIGTPVIGIVGRTYGYTAQMATECIIIPEVTPEHVTPHAEEFQSIIWHLMCNHPKLKVVHNG